MSKDSIYATAILAGSIIGVGFFSLPFILVRSGILITLAWFLVIGFLVYITHQLFAEVCQKTPDFLRLPGYAEYHLGKPWKIVATIFSTFSGYGALLAYMIIAGVFLGTLFDGLLSNQMFSLIYFIIGTIFIFWGIKPIAKICLFELFISILIVVLIFGFGALHINISQLSLVSGNFFLPYGPILFSLWGASMIPETEEYLRKNKKDLKKVVAFSVLIPFIVYLGFSFAVAMISGLNTTDDAISGLLGILDQKLILFLIFSGILTTFTSFVALGVSFEKTFRFDFKLPRIISFLLVVLVPLACFLIGLNDFLRVISFIGGVMMGLEAVLICVMSAKVTKRKFLSYSLIPVFVGGIIYETIHFIHG